jgi:hypothetical protein
MFLLTSDLRSRAFNVAKKISSASSLRFFMKECSR